MKKINFGIIGFAMFIIALLGLFAGMIIAASNPLASNWFLPFTSICGGLMVFGLGMAFAKMD